MVREQFQKGTGNSRRAVHFLKTDGSRLRVDEAATAAQARGRSAPPVWMFDVGCWVFDVSSIDREALLVLRIHKNQPLGVRTKTNQRHRF